MKESAHKSFRQSASASRFPPNVFGKRKALAHAARNSLLLATRSRLISRDAISARPAAAREAVKSSGARYTPDGKAFELPAIRHPALVGSHSRMRLKLL